MEKCESDLVTNSLLEDRIYLSVLYQNSFVNPNDYKKGLIPNIVLLN